MTTLTQRPTRASRSPGREQQPDLRNSIPGCLPVSCQQAREHICQGFHNCLPVFRWPVEPHDTGQPGAGAPSQRAGLPACPVISQLQFHSACSTLALRPVRLPAFLQLAWIAWPGAHCKGSSISTRRDHTGLLCMVSRCLVNRQPILPARCSCS